MGAKNAPNGSRAVRVLGDRTIRVPTGAPYDAIVDQLAASQRGRMARWQLLAAGVSSYAVTRRVRRGRLIRLHWGGYGVPHSETLPLAPDTAALLAAGPGAVLSHHSAAVLWQLRVGIANPVHVTVADGRRGPVRARGVVAHRSRILAPRDAVIHAGLPVTSPARTLLDVAALLGDRDVERMLDEAVFALKLVSERAIADVLRRAGGHPGAATLARVAGAHQQPTRTESPPEEQLLSIIRAAGLPAPIQQDSILGYRVDFHWPQSKLVVEVDAYGTHGSPARFERDRRRDARLLTEAGIAVIRLTRGRITSHPYEVAALLARAIAPPS